MGEVIVEIKIMQNTITPGKGWGGRSQWAQTKLQMAEEKLYLPYPPLPLQVWKFIPIALSAVMGVALPSADNRDHF